MNTELPLCPSGSTCYRKCKNHFEKYSHNEEYYNRKIINRTFTSLLSGEKFNYYSGYVFKNREKILKQWLITQEKWITDRDYRDPLLGLARNDFGIRDNFDLPEEEKICCFGVYLNMYRHHY